MAAVRASADRWVSARASILLVGSNLGLHHVNWIKGKPGSIDLGGGTANAVAAIGNTVDEAYSLIEKLEVYGGI